MAPSIELFHPVLGTKITVQREAQAAILVERSGWMYPDDVAAPEEGSDDAGESGVQPKLGTFGRPAGPKGPDGADGAGGSDDESGSGK